MRRFSAFAIAREAFRNHEGWGRTWARATPKKRYDVIIVGAGGPRARDGLLPRQEPRGEERGHPEKGWLGGGNTGRNTTIIRSNYLQDPSAALYEKARGLYETLSQDLNYNVMFSPARRHHACPDPSRGPWLQAHRPCQTRSKA